MKKIKLVIFLSTVGLASCQRINFSNPEEVLKNYRWLTHNHNNTAIYDDYLSSESKKDVNKDAFIRERQDTLQDTIIAEKIYAYPQDENHSTYRRFKVEDTYMLKDKPRDTLRGRYYYTLINENGKWKVIWTATLESFGEKASFDANYAVARTTFEKILDINPFNGVAYDKLAWTYYRDNSLKPNERKQGIVKNIKYAIILEDDNFVHYNTLATYYVSIQNYDLAIESYLKGINCALNPSDRQTLYANVCAYYLVLNQPEKAEECIHKAIMIDSTQTFPWFKYGLMRATEGDPDNALRYLNKAISMHTMDNFNEEKLYYTYALLTYSYKNDCQTAKEYVLKALDISPDNRNYQDLYDKVNACPMHH